MTVAGNQVSASGVIVQISDVDYFSFATGAGPVRFTVGHLSNSVNLSPVARLYNASGNLLATANPDANFNDTINFTVATRGTYYLSVTDTGRSSRSTPTNYGFNVGQYTIAGTVVTPNQIAALSPQALEAFFTDSSRYLGEKWNLLSASKRSI